MRYVTLLCYFKTSLDVTVTPLHIGWMPFVKLDCSMLESSIWGEKTQRDIFITALLMAEPYEVRTPMPQIEVLSLKKTGFKVPPGWYGFVGAASTGIIRDAMVDRSEGLEAIKQLGEPDLQSRSQIFEGRRMVRVEGGFIILNFINYRDRDYTGAERQKRWRERQKTEKARKDGITLAGPNERPTNGALHPAAPPDRTLSDEEERF